MNLNFYSKATLTLSSLRKSFVFCLVAAILFVNNSQAQTGASALAFDGSDDYVTIPAKPGLNTSTYLTIEAWIKPTGTVGVQDVISKSSSSVNNGYIFPRTVSGWTTIEFLLNISGYGWQTLRVNYGAAKRNQWHHVAATYDGYNMNIYIDAVLAGSYAFSGSISVNNNPLTLGNQPGYEENYAGHVDDARIFNRALSQCEIAQTMNCELTGSEDGLVAYYKFNQGLLGLPNPLVTTVIDASPSGANGTLVNFGLLGTGVLSNWTQGTVSATTCAAFVPTVVTAGSESALVPIGGMIKLTASSVPGATYSWTGPNGFTSTLQNPTINGVGLNASGTYTVTAMFNGCGGSASTVITVAPMASGLNFDGQNDWVNIPSSPTLSTGTQLSVEAWILPTGGNTSIQNVASAGSNTSGKGFKFPRTEDKWTTLSFDLYVDNVLKTITAPIPSGGLNVWNHVAATYDGYFMRMYINGTQVAFLEAPGSYSPSPDNVILGNQNGRLEFYKGVVDELRLWGRAISQCEIINNMKTCELNGDNNGLANQVALNAYYRFNQGLVNVGNASYTTLADSSGHSNNGTLLNFALTGLESNWVPAKVYGICDYFPLPFLAASANGSTFQTGSTAKLFAVYGNNNIYTWDGPNSFSTAVQNPVLTNVQPANAGVYTVTTPYINCVVTASTKIKVSNLAQIIAAGPTTFCPSGSVSLSTATTGTAYQWFLNEVAINGATANNYTATLGGNYTVTVTNGTDVVVSAPLAVTITPDVTAPVANTASLPTLNGVAPYTVTTIPTATDACAGSITGTSNLPLTFTQSGNYTITWSYNDGNGNTSTQTQNVVVTRPVDVTPPVLTVPANITVAAGATCNAVVTFAATATDESEDPTVTITYSQNPGTTFPIGTTTVTVTAKDASNNISTGSFTVTVTSNVMAPITGTTTICAGSTTTLSSATTGGTWSSANSAVASVNAAGVVTGVSAGTTNILYSNSCGAWVTASVTVNALPAAPSVAVVNNCGSSTLTASNYTGSILWSNGASTPSITVSNAATYTVTQTSNGCTSATGTGVSAPKVTPAAPSVAVVNNCGSSTLTASNYTGTLSWSNGATTASINVSNAATYTVTQTVNGCTSAAGTGVSAPKVTPAAPTVAVANNCGSTTLTASNYTGSILWSNGANTPSITVTNAVTYTVTQTSNGCTSAAGSGVSAPKAIPTAPTVTVDNSVCGSSTLTASNYAGSILWSNGATTASITVTNAATYTVTQTVNGCTSAAGSGVSAPKAAQTTPVITVTNNCGSTTLTASNYTGSVIWSNNATTASITITAAGNYSVTATNASGCSATSSVTNATVNTNPVVAGITGSTSVVAGSATQLANTTSGGVWSSSNANATVNANGLVTGVTAGTTVITYTVTSGAGCSTSVTTTVTVTPYVPTCIAPAFTTTVSNISVNTTSGCTAAASYTVAASGTTPAISYTFTGATTGSGTGTGSGGTFNTGITAVTIKATNNCGTVTTSFTVTVKDVTAPSAITKNITVALDANGQATVVPSQVDNGSSDNCGNVTLAFKAAGTTTTTSTGTICATADENGTLQLTAPAGATITAINFASYGTPNGSCGSFTVNSSCNAPNSKSIVEGYALGNNSVSIPANNDVFTDPCYGTVKRLYVQATYTLNVATNANTVSSLSFDCSKKGTNTVTLSVTDAAGNTSTQNATVTVVDNTAPSFTAVANQTFCGAPTISYTVPVLAASDNCGTPTVTYTVTGATNRTGTGSNASGAFSAGTSTITWTVKDASNNTTTSTTTVVVGGGPVATIAAASASADFCSELILTGSSSVSGSSYKWVSGSTTVGTSQQFSLGQDNAEGVYQLYVTTPGGCTSTAASYTFNKQNLLSSYTILAYSSATLGKYNKVSSGSVGITSSWGYAYFKGSTAVNGPNSFVKAPYIYKGSSDVITKQVSGIASASTPAMQYNTSNANGYANYSTAQYSTVTVNGNFKNLTIRKGTYATLSGTIFGTIELEEGASVRFTNATINIDKLLVDDGARDGYYSYVRFAPNSSVRVSTQVSVGSQVLVNPDNYKVTFYMGDNKCDAERFTVKGADTKVIANIIMPNGKLFVTSTDCDNDSHGNCGHSAHSSWNCPHKGHNHKDCDHKAHNTSDCNDDVYMTGTFIVESVESAGNTVIWNSFDCGSPSVPVTVVNKTSPSVVTTSMTAETVSATTEEELKITVMPNPSTTFFTLKFESKYETPVTMRVMDANGRVVDAQSKIGSNSTIKIGANYASGTYYAEMIQGTKRKVVQLIKVRG